MFARKAPLASDLDASEASPPLRAGTETPASALARFIDSIAFALSAILSPYIVIPVGTIGIVWARSPGVPVGTRLLWVAISVLFSTLLPAFYVVWGIKKGIITDVHVMEREQRNVPFAVAIVGGCVAALILHLLGAPRSVWGLSVILAVNGGIIYVITLFTKISVHVSVLSATVLGATMLNPDLEPLTLLWMIPPLIWARWRRGRHSLWQGIAGCLVASGVTALTLSSIHLGERVTQFIHRLF